MPVTEVTIEGIAALVAVLLTLLTLMCGGAWWASAIYTRVGQLIKELQALNVQMAALAQSHDKDSHEIWSEIGKHGERITKVESKLGL